MLIMLLSFGCGGGGGSAANTSGTPAANTPATPAKVVISFSLISTAKLPFRLNGVQISATLPAGLTVTASGSTIASGLEAGSVASSAVNTNFPVFGRYSAPNRVTLVIADSSNAQTGFGPGEMARLTCSLAAGIAISESDRLTLENAITFKASGWDPTAATNPVSLNRFLKPRIVIIM